MIYKSLLGIVWNSGHLDDSELPNFFPSDVQGEFLAKRTENAKIFAVLLVKRWKIWKIMAVPKFKISLMTKLGIVRVTHSDTRPDFTMHSTRQKGLVTG